MNLQLVKASKEYQSQIVEMLEEWILFNNTHDTNHSPWAIFKNDYHDFDNYLERLDIIDNTKGYVPGSTFFCFDSDSNKMVGAVNIRHYLNASLLKNGGHIGDGVRPSMRRKGIATKMIGLALAECRRLGIPKVLMVCDKDNIGSRKSIVNNGGILENEIECDGKIEQRYWINLDSVVIKKLNVFDYQGKKIHVEYDTTGYYEIEKKDFGFAVSYQKFYCVEKRCFDDTMFAPWLENPIAYGAFINNSLVGYIEGFHEKWNNRFRISNICVFNKQYRNLNIGHCLILKMEAIAKEINARMIVLETQSCNENAIAFYQKNGFEMIGFDLYSYSNDDPNKKVVRIEMGKKI